MFKTKLDATNNKALVNHKCSFKMAGLREYLTRIENHGDIGDLIDSCLHDREFALNVSLF
jgi:hypothetical protein